MSNQISVQEIMNAQHDSAVSQPTRTAASYAYLTASGGQNLVKSGAGVLLNVIVGNPLTSAVQAWDNTVSGGTTIFKLNTNTSAQVFNLGLKFANGLTVSAGSVLDNVTLIYL